MGVVNTTPDSFSDGGKHYHCGSAIDAAVRMVEEGAGVVDVGGESTRPGAVEVGEEEEGERVVPVIEGIRREMAERGKDVIISVDTRRAKGEW